MKLKTQQLMIIATAFLLSTGALSAEWKVQPEASTIAFTAYSRMHDADGLFKQWAFDGKISDNWTGTGKIVIKTASVDTANAKRDAHLKNEDFFNVEKHPEAVFTIEQAELKGDRLLLTGKLTMVGVTKPLTLDLKRTVSGNSAELSGETMIKRSDFGITYSSMINPIKDEVKLVFKVALKKG